MRKFFLFLLTILCGLSFAVALYGCDNSNDTSNVKVYKPESLDNAISLGVMDFSAWNGDGVDSDDREIKSDKILGEIKSVFLASDVNYKNNLYKNEKIAISNSENSVKIIDVVICTDHETDNVYLATLNVYTRLITSVKDLRMFDQGLTVDGLRKITGCYALTKNLIDATHVYNKKSIYIQNYYAVIGASESEVNQLGYTLDTEGNCLNKDGKIAQYANASSLFGFAGSFDGRGYSLTFSCGSGLFNQLLYGAEVKNVAFKDIAVLSGVSAASEQHDYSRRGPIGYAWESEEFSSAQIKISDVFISFEERSFYELTAVNKGLTVLPIARRGVISYNNILVDINYDYASTDVVEDASVIPKNKFCLLSYARYKINTFTPFNNVLTVVQNQAYANEEYLTPFTLVNNVYSGGTYLPTSYYEENLPVYDSFDDMIYKISSDTLNSFDNGFWDISLGYPVWKK